MPRSLRGVLCLSFACAATLGIAACGGSDDNSDSATTGDTPAATDGGGRTGGEIRTAYTSFPDYLDPALSYTQEGWQTLWTVYTPLLTYKHAEGAEGATVVPGLRSEEHTSELQSQSNLVCRLLLEKKNRQ